MNLKEYMSRKRMPNRMLACVLDCSVPQIVLARRGKVSAKFARQIEKYTEGLVTVKEILDPIPWPPSLDDEDKEAA